MAEKPQKTVTTINGRRVSKDRARISVFDNALLYAEGLFETLLAFEDHVVLLEEHLDRLYRGVEVTQLQIPVDRKTLARWMLRTVAAHPDKVKKLRLTVTSGEAERWTGIQGKPKIILSAAPHQLPRRPWRIQVSDLRVDHRSVFRRIKTLSYALHAAALKRAKCERCDDALLLNENGNVAEITSANIFWVRKQTIFTPPLSSGCLEGVTREVTIDQSRKLGYRVVEKAEKLDSMLTADEIFLTSSLKLITPISEIVTGKESFRFPSGPVTMKLRKHIRTYVREYPRF